MKTLVLLNLFHELGKRDKMRCLLSLFISFCNKLIQEIEGTNSRLYLSLNMTLKLLRNSF